MTSEEERFDPVAARKAREDIVVEIERVKRMQEALVDPKKVGDATPVMRHDSPEFPATEYLERREKSKEALRSARSNLEEVLEVIDKKLAEHEDS